MKNTTIEFELNTSKTRAFQGEVISQFLAKIFPNGIVDRVLLISPPDADAALFDLDIARRGTYSNFPPYGLGIISQHLKKLNVDVRIINLNQEILEHCNDGNFDYDKVWRSKLDKEINKFNPHLIGVTCMFTMTHNSLKNVCQYVSKFDVPIMIGGVHISNDTEKVLDDIPEANIAIVQEGDIAVQLLIKAIRGEIGAENLGQIVFNDKSGRIAVNKQVRPESAEFDILPSYEKFEIKSLSKYGVIGSFHAFKSKTTKFSTVLMNRGCRAQCTFCSVRNFNGMGVRGRSVESVLDELQLLSEVYGIEHIMWLDDDLLRDHKKSIQLFNGMVKRGINMTWDASNGVLAMSCVDDVIAAAEASGCIGLIIGMESGNDDILKSTRKPAKRATYLAAADVLRKYQRIYSNAFLMIGFPYETMSQIQDTIEVALEMNLDWYRIKPLQPLPNTAIYKSMLEDGLIHDSNEKDVRYMTGAYGKSRDLENTKITQDSNFKDIFSSIPLDAIPNKAQIDDIWFYMNYKLNYERVLKETRPIKLEQNLKFVKSICDIISPDNAFALYTLAHLQGQNFGKADILVLDSLKSKLASSDFWRNRFETFGLSLSDLR